LQETEAADELHRPVFTPINARIYQETPRGR
jgi:hypothetical protein